MWEPASAGLFGHLLDPASLSPHAELRESSLTRLFATSVREDCPVAYVLLQVAAGSLAGPESVTPHAHVSESTIFVFKDVFFKTHMCGSALYITNGIRHCLSYTMRMFCSKEQAKSMHRFQILRGIFPGEWNPPSV